MTETDMSLDKPRKTGREGPNFEIELALQDRLVATKCQSTKPAAKVLQKGTFRARDSLVQAHQ